MGTPSKSMLVNLLHQTSFMYGRCTLTIVYFHIWSPLKAVASPTLPTTVRTWFPPFDNGLPQHPSYRNKIISYLEQIHNII